VTHSWVVGTVSAALLIGLSSPVTMSQASGAVDDSGYQLLNNRVTADRGEFYIYQDGDSGFNHSFPSGFIGDTNKITINTACIDDPSSSSGCSNNLLTVDQQHGNVAQITFQPLPSNDWAGLDFEEPQHYVANLNGVGYDVRGATEILFQVRSPTGITVQFGAGRATTRFVTLPQSRSYVSACIPLVKGAACPKGAMQLDLMTDISTELDSMHILFTVVSNFQNAPTGGVVLLDNIQYLPVPNKQKAALSLPLSTQTFGVVPVEKPDPKRYWPIPPDQVNRNIAALYEASLTMMTLIARGDTEDVTSARAIADALVYALTHDNQGDPLPISSGGAHGLHNAYASGDLTLLNSQGSTGGQAGQIRFAGFTATEAGCGSRSYCLVLDGATGGNNAFAMLALLKVFHKTGDSSYLDGAINIGNWISGLLLDTSKTGFGGYFAGYPDQGMLATNTCRKDPLHCLNKGKSTENNADIFAAFSALANTETGLGNATTAKMWAARASVAGDFVMAMFNSSRGCFYAGTVPKGTAASRGIEATGPLRGDDLTNVFDFLDTNSFTYLAMAPSKQYGKAINWSRVVSCLNRFSATAMVNDIRHTYSGYSLVTPSEAVAPLGTAWEFTGQAGDVIAISGGNPSSVLINLRSARNTAPFGDRLGLVASTLANGDTLAPDSQCLSTPFQCIPERVGIAATSWWILAEREYNPFY
jgi:hypothetical protein